MTDFEALQEAVGKGDVATAKTETEKGLSGGAGAQSILDDGLIAAMKVVGDRFSAGKIFVPQMLRSAKTMQACVDLLRPHFDAEAAASRGTMIIGSVKGDLHDIGKNLVSMMMGGAGFEIVDLGVDVPPERYVQKARETEADLLGMSALLATTMTSMKDTISALHKAGLRKKLKVMVGGAPVTERYAREIKADAYAPDAGSAVSEAKKLLGIE